MGRRVRHGRRQVRHRLDGEHRRGTVLTVPADLEVSALPLVDRHAVVVGAAPAATWDRAADVVRRTFSGTLPRLVAPLLGCDPARRTGADWPAPGSAVPGFRVAVVDRPRGLVIRGRHRFSRYAIVLRVEPYGAGSRCVLESRAEFPGPHGRLYRMAVVGSGGHRASVRRLLAAVAERGHRTSSEK